MNWSEIKVGARYQLNRPIKVEGIEDELVGIRVTGKNTEQTGSSTNRYVLGIYFRKDGMLFNNTEGSRVFQGGLSKFWIQTDEEKARYELMNQEKKNLQEKVKNKAIDLGNMFHSKGIDIDVTLYGIRIEVKSPYGEINRMIEALENFDKLEEVLNGTL